MNRVFAKMWRIGLFSVLIASLYAQDSIKISDINTVDSSTRIIGGNATTIENYPFVVQILYVSQLSCGGSLITQRHVLTAAHCFIATNGQQVSAAYFTVRVGSTYLSGGTIISVSSIKVHESYNTPIRDNDIAIMTLASRVTLSSTVATVTVASSTAVVPDNALVTTVGWGRTNVSVEQASPVLNEVHVYKINHSVCEGRYTYLQQVTGDPYIVTSNMICAGILNVGGKDACQGDSGGPLLRNNVVVGITSWGWGCAQPLFPGVYARVSAYTTWINNTVSGVTYTRNNAATPAIYTHFLILFSLILVSTPC